MTPRTQGRQSVLLGMARVARGRPDGLSFFGATTQSVTASLAPLVAFPLVGGLLLLATGAWHDALSNLLATVCALMTPLAVSYELARLWGREEHWLRFATAFNWCQWILPLLGSLMLIVLSVAVGAGLSEHVAAAMVILGLGGYALWMHWFLARHGLVLGRWRAAGLVLAVNVTTVVLVVVPRLLMAEG
jgi:hypothetical protein